MICSGTGVFDNCFGHSMGNSVWRLMFFSSGKFSYFFDNFLTSFFLELIRQMLDLSSPFWASLSFYGLEDYLDFNISIKFHLFCSAYLKFQLTFFSFLIVFWIISILLGSVFFPVSFWSFFCLRFFLQCLFDTSISRPYDPIYIICPKEAIL